MLQCRLGNSVGGKRLLRTSLLLKSVGILLIVLATVTGAYAETVGGADPVIWIALGSISQLTKAMPGATLEGKLARGFYWRGTELFPRGIAVRMVIDQIESRKKSKAMDDRPFVMHLFAPRHEVVAQFRSVNVLMPGGDEVPLRTTFLALTQRTELSAAKAKRAREGPAAAVDRG